MRNIKVHKIEKTIIKNMIKGGFCSKYKGDPCGKIETRIDPIAPLGILLNGILNILQNGVLKVLTDGLNYIFDQWNKNIYKLSTTLEKLILLIIFAINGYNDAVNKVLDDFRLLLRIQVAILTSGGPIYLLSVFVMPVVNELISFFLDSATLDVVTALLFLDFRPAINLLKATLNLAIGKTVKSKCNLEDYGNNKRRMNNECYEFMVPKCKVNIKTLFYISFTLLILIYISCWISFFKIFYPD